MKNKLKIPSEIVYIIAMFLISFAVAITTGANLGLSMIVAPAYIISKMLPVLTFGQCEYIVQTVLFIILCIVVKKVKLVYFSSYITGLICGFLLDMFLLLIPSFNNSTNFNIFVRILFFIIGSVLTALAIALLYKTYFYPQVYDFFVKIIASCKNLNLIKFKRIYDGCMFGLSAILALLYYLFFEKALVGINIGTIILTFITGPLIGVFLKLIDKFTIITPLFPKFARYFSFDDISEKSI